MIYTALQNVTSTVQKEKKKQNKTVNEKRKMKMN